MRSKGYKILTSRLLCLMLIVAMALMTVGCGTNAQGEESTSSVETQVSAENSESGQDAAKDVKVLGEGQTKFQFVVVDREGQETDFEIHTDQTTVGDALLELELIAGEESQYGLYVKTVNGITADYDVDQTYWAFYVNGEYASAGVDATEVEEGATYSFKVE